MLLDRRRYKQGFERVAIVAFIVVAATFTLIYLNVPESYQAPDPQSEAGLALEAELLERCGPLDEDPLVSLCRDQVLSERSWAFYKQQIDPLRIGILWLACFGGAALLIGRRTWRWLAEGFKDQGDQE